MEIRRLAEADLPALAGLYKQFWNEDSIITNMQAVFKKLKDNPNYIFLVAQRGGELTGSVMGIVCEELYGDCRPFFVIEDVIVDKNHRRCGVGTALMHELERLAVELGCKYVIFVTESDRVEAHQFYESLGYKMDGYRGFKKRL